MHLYNSPHRRDVSLLNSHPALPNLNIIHPVRYWLRSPRGTFHSGGGPALTPGQFPMYTSTPAARYITTNTEAAMFSS